MTNSELLNELFKKYNLNYDKDHPESKENDVFIHKHYKIITRGGIQKIEKAAGIICDIEVVDAISTPTNVTMRGKGLNASTGISYTTFASASPETSSNKYYAEMAEKRCRSRLVLTLAGLYELGVFGEDEADTFKTVVDTQRAGTSTGTAASTRTTTYKGA